MSTIKVDSITDEAGTGAPNFPNGATGLDPFKYDAVSGATQALDVGSANFFDAGTLTADTTVSFSNVPTEAQWSYSYVPANLATSFDITSADTENSSPSMYSQSNTPFGVFIGSAGSKLYMAGGNGFVYQYTLLTAYDITTLSYDSVSFNVSLYFSTEGMGVFFSTDGTQMYVSGNTNGIVSQHTLSTAWDLSTASYSGKSMNVSSYVTYGRDITFKEDGTRIYFMDQAGDIVQCDLSTAWDLSTFTYNGNFATTGYNANGIELSNDGTKLFITYGSDKIVHYTLSTAWSITSASKIGEVSMSGYGAGTGLHLPSGSTSLYGLSTSVDKVFNFSSEDVSTLTLPSSVQGTQVFTGSVGTRATYDFFTQDGGTTVHRI